MGTLSRTWGLMRASFAVLQQDREMLLFPLLSGISLLILGAGGVSLVAWGDRWLSLPGGLAGNAVMYAALFTFYYVVYFVAVFFNTALIASATLRLTGGDPTVSYGLGVALSRIGAIAGWALFASTVMMLIRAVESRLEGWTRVGTTVAGAAWSVATFFVVPIIALEGKGPTAALRGSAALVRETWGDQVVSGVGFGLIGFLLVLPGVAAGGAIVLAYPAFPFLIVVGTVGVYFLTITLLQTTLRGIFEAALFAHASGAESRGFPPQLLQRALRRK